MDPKPPEQQPPAEPTPPTPPSGGSRSWFATHGRDLRFLVIFATFMVGYYGLTTTTKMKTEFFPWYLKFNARLAAGTLNFFGYDGVEAKSTALTSKHGSISVERGCDAVEPTALFAAAVLASPVAFGTKIPAIIAGALFLAVVNVIRIISLFLSAAHWKEAFDILHLDVWQAVFIFLALMLWLMWVSWAVKRQKRLARV